MQQMTARWADAATLVGKSVTCMLNASFCMVCIAWDQLELAMESKGQQTCLHCELCGVMHGCRSEAR